MKWGAGIFLAAVFSMFTVWGCGGGKECEDENSKVPRYDSEEECKSAQLEDCEKLKKDDAPSETIWNCEDGNERVECEQCNEGKNGAGATKWREPMVASNSQT